MQKSLKQYFPEIFGIILCLGVGITASIATNSSDYFWYAALKKPSFNPPQWLFAPVWIFLYILMGIALGQIYKLREQFPALRTLFVVQLILNALWSPLFFQMHQIGLALVDLFLLACTVWTLTVKSYQSRRWLGYLIMPYALWVSFAFVLNLYLYLLNS